MANTDWKLLIPSGISGVRVDGSMMEMIFELRSEEKYSANDRGLSAPFTPRAYLATYWSTVTALSASGSMVMSVKAEVGGVTGAASRSVPTVVSTFIAASNASRVGLGEGARLTPRVRARSKIHRTSSGVAGIGRNADGMARW